MVLNADRSMRNSAQLSATMPTRAFHPQNVNISDVRHKLLSGMFLIWPQPQPPGDYAERACGSLSWHGH